MILRGTVRILSFMKHDIKVFSAIYGDNWQSLNIITTGETFAQMVFEMMSGPAASLYSERSGNYQNQSGVTWSKK